MGVLESGPAAREINFTQGVMNVGEPMAVPIIRELKKWESDNSYNIEIRDAPPGASCPVVETIRGADFVLLVTEPTPFGLHDLKQVAEIARELGLRTGVIINRDGIGDDAVQGYCDQSGIPVLMRIPMDRQIAEGIAQGHPLIEIKPELGPMFSKMLEQIVQQVV
jgi:MinD superfamily P-loop ATPase